MAQTITQPETSAEKQSSRKPSIFEGFFKLTRILATILNILKEELFCLGRNLGAWPLAVWLIGATGLFFLAYQTPLEWRYQLGPQIPYDHLYIQSFNPAESNAEFGFRWSTGESYLRFPGAGTLPTAQLAITMQAGGRPAQFGLPKVEVWAEDRLLGAVEVRPDVPTYTFDYQAKNPNRKGDLIFSLKVPDAFKSGGHNLPLGVVVTEVRLSSQRNAAGLVIPALPYCGLLLVALLVIYLALARSGWTSLWAAGLTTIPTLAVACGLAFYRMHLTPATEALFIAVLLAYPLLALGLRVTAGWLRLRQMDFPLWHGRWLGIFFLSGFGLKVAGLNHPAFRTIDHWFRVHQINRFWENSADFWQQYYSVSAGASVTGADTGSAVLGQWGVQVAMPYSPLFYIFAAPLSLIWPAHNDPNLLAAVNALAGWLELSQIFLLYFIVRRLFAGEWAGRAGVIAAGIFAFYPLSFLLFSDGGYNGIFANWLTLLFVALLLDYLQKWQLDQPRKLVLGLTILALAAALLAHTSTLLLLGSLLGVYTAILLFRGSTRPVARQLIIVSLGGLGLATLLYYGWYVPGLLTRTLPTLFGKLGSGSIGQDSAKLGTDLLGGFWPQLWEHFRLWPFLLALLCLALFALPALNQRVLKPAPSEISAISPNSELLLTSGDYSGRNSYGIKLLFAWLIVFGLFALVDLRVNLLQKHMLFAAPLLCIGSGLVLSQAWHGLAQLKNSKMRLVFYLLIGIVAGLLLSNFATGAGLWYARIFYVTYQPGSG